MSKRILVQKPVDPIATSAEDCAATLVRASLGLKLSSPCYWDDLDYLLQHLITDDTRAKCVVDALMDDDVDVVVEHGDTWAASEEIAIRIIGKRELRFGARERHLQLTAERPTSTRTATR